MAVELKVKFSLDTASVTKGMRALSGINKFAIAPLGAAIKQTAMLGAAVAGAAVAIGGVAFRSAQNYADSIAKMSDKTGMGTETLSKLAYAASLADVQMTGLETGIVKSQKAIAEASNGSKTAAASIEQIGLSVSELKKMTPEQFFLTVLDAISKVPGQANKVNAAMDLLGKSGAESLKLLAGGMPALLEVMGQAKGMGLVVDQEQAKKAAEFNDSITRLKGSVTGLSLAFFDAARITDIVDRITAAVVRLRESDGFKVFAQKFNDSVSWITDAVNALIDTWNGMSVAHREQLQNMLVGAGAFVVAWKSGFLGMILKGLGNLISTQAWAFTAFAGSLVALDAFVVGYKIGEALEESFNLSSILLEGQAFLSALGKSWNSFFGTIGALAVTFGSEIINAMSGKGFNMDNILDVMDDFDAEMAEHKKKLMDDFNDIDAEDARRGTAPVGGNTKERLAKFGDELKKEFLTAKGWSDDFKKLVPDSILKFLDDLDANLAKIPEGAKSTGMEKFKGDLEEAGVAASKLNQALMPLRGFAGSFEFQGKKAQRLGERAGIMAGAVPVRPGAVAAPLNNRGEKLQAEGNAELKKIARLMERNGPQISFAA